MNLRISEQVM